MGAQRARMGPAWLTTEEFRDHLAPAPLRIPLQSGLVGRLLRAIDDRRLTPLMHYPAGQSVGYFSQVETVEQRVERLLQETARALDV